MRITLVLLLTAVFCGNAFSQDQTRWLTLPNDVEFHLREESARCSVRIPFGSVPDGINTEDIRVRLIDVEHDGSRHKALASLFTADFDVGMAPHFSSLVIEGEAALVLPGSYRITALIEYTRVNSVETVQQLVEVHVQQRQPELEVVVAPLIVDQEYGFFGVTQRSSRLQLRETSGTSSVTGLNFSDVRNPDSGHPVDEGMILAEVDEGRIAAGALGAAKISLLGHFPLRTTSGKLEVRADQLSKPILVDYQVRAKRTPHWISVLTALGFFFGWLVRVFLKEQQRLHETLARATDVVQKIHQTRADIPDQEFLRQTDSILTNLDQSVSKRVSAEVLEASNVAITSLQRTVTDFEARRSGLLERLEPLLAILNRGWVLPQSQMFLLAEIRATCPKAELLLRQNRTSDAAELLANLERLDLVRLDNLLNAWANDAALYLNRLVSSGLPLTAVGSRELDSAVKVWVASFSGQSETSTVATVDSVTASLERVHSGRSAFGDIASHLIEDVGRLSVWIDDVLDAPLRPIEAALEELKACNENAAKAVLEEIDQPKEFLKRLAGRHLDVRRTWERILVSLLPSGVAPVIVLDPLRAGNWIAAIEKTCESLPRVRGGRSLPAEDEPAMERVSVASLSYIPLTFRTVYAKVVPDNVPGRRPFRDLKMIAEQRRVFEGTARLASFLQTAFLAVLFMFFSEVLFGENWVGTGVEMLSLFVWAFGVDVSAETFLDAVKRLRPPGPPFG